MKNQHEFLRIMILLPLLLFYSTTVYTQLAKDPQRDLSVGFSSKHKGTDPGFVFGEVRNNSANAYPCVRVEFNLGTRFDLRLPGQGSSHLGVLPVEVQNVQPRSVRSYQQPLPFPAGIALKSISECPKQPPKELPDAPKILSFIVVPTRIHAGQTTTLQWRTANTEKVLVGERNPEWPRTSPEPILAPRGVEPSGSMQFNPSQTITYRLEATKGAASVTKDVTVEVTSSPTPAATCSITGQVFSRKLQWDTKDDRGQPVSFTLTHIYMTMPGTDQPVRARILGRKYIFANVPAGQTYKVFPGNFRSQPREIDVPCRPNKTHRGVDFAIIGPPLSG